VLEERLREQLPGRIQLPAGSRQVGKTRLLLDMAREFGEAAIYVADDQPDAALPGFRERCWSEAEARAQNGIAVPLLEEIHRLPDWAARLKRQWDRLRRRLLPPQVVATMGTGRGAFAHFSTGFTRHFLLEATAIASPKIGQYTVGTRRACNSTSNVPYTERQM